MADPQDKYRSLVEKLYDRTINGKLTWQLDDWDDKLVVTKMAKYGISLTYGQNAEGEPLEIVNIMNNNGEVIDTFNDEFVAGMAPSIGNFINYWYLMRNLRDTAARQAKGVDKAIDEIIESLDEDDAPF